jgi:hypothetical protein
MITVVCVNVGDYLGRGDEYVAKLRAMVAHNLQAPHAFECIRESDKFGWWAKVDLFAPGRFSGRVLYLDLDTAIVGPLDALVGMKGIIHLTDWGWTRNDYCSAVMVWDAREHEDIFTRYSRDAVKNLHGDQDWITQLGGWQALPKGLCVSYRYECKVSPPAGASVVCFHGQPKPHEIRSGWVPAAWR